MCNSWCSEGLLEKFAAVYTEKIQLALIREFSGGADECITSGARTFFHVSIVGLAGDGNQQSIVESSPVGVCRSCLIGCAAQHNKISKVVQETYNGIKFGRGQGLWIQSFKLDSKDNPVL